MNEEFVVRYATEKDYTYISELARQVHNMHSERMPSIYRDTTNPLPYDYFLALIGDDSSNVIVSCYKDRVIGYVIVLVRNTPNIEPLQPRTFAVIDNIVVSEEFRGKKVGTLLVNKCIKWAKEKGATSLELTVSDFNKEAVNFYKSFGMDFASHKMSVELQNLETLYPTQITQAP